MGKGTFINICLVVFFGTIMETCNSGCVSTRSFLSCDSVNEESFVYEMYNWKKKYLNNVSPNIQVTNSKVSLGYVYQELQSITGGNKHLNLTNSLIALQLTNIEPINQLSVLNLTSNNFNNLQELKTIFNYKLNYLYLTGNNFQRVERAFPEDLWALHLDKCNISSINSDAFKDMYHLQSLVLSGNNLKSFNSSLKGLTSLYSLDISNNNIESIEETDLPVNTLSYLDLRNNKLTWVDDSILNSFYSAHSLLLGGNKINKINAMQSISVKNLDLSNCGITKIEKNWFKITRPTQYLNLDDNEIAEINEFDFSTLSFDSGSGLGRLSLNNAGIKSIAPNAFNGAEFLNFLELNGNDIKILKDYTFNNTAPFLVEITDSNLVEIERNAFQGSTVFGKIDLSRNLIEESITLCTLPNVTEVDFSHNSLKNLADVRCVRDIKVLNLTNNSLENIEGTAFQGLATLQSLDLSDNYLTTINPNTFTPLNQLRFLNLSKNFIVNVTHFGAQLKQVTDLNLSFNNMTSLELNAFNEIKNLKVLNLHGNYFTSLDPSVFSNTIELNKLTLTFNGPIKMHQFSRLAFLEELEFFYSNISTIEAFSTMGLLRVKSLKFSNDSHVSNIEINALSGLANLVNCDFEVLFKNVNVLQEGLFDGLSSVTELDLSGLNINTISKNAFKGLNRLNFLNLTNNKINLVDADAFVDLQRLENLDLSHNEIEIFQTGTFSGLSNLKTLNVSNNQLFDLQPDIVFPLKGVQFLDLEYNSIFKINYPEIINNLKLLSKIRVNYNMWHCADLVYMLGNFTANSISYKDDFAVSADYSDNVDGIFCH